MGQRRKPDVTRESPAEREMRNQEVLRANRELSAYFKGRRTEREARAALKIIKAFVRDRERRDASSRAPLPGANAAKAPQVSNRKAASDSGRRQRRKVRRGPQASSSTSATAPIEAEVNPDLTHSPESDDRRSD